MASAAQKRTHSSSKEDVVYQTTSRTTTTTTTTTVVTTTTNGLGTTKETAILVDSDSDGIPTGKPIRKKKATMRYPCGSGKWVLIPDEMLDNYDLTAACKTCGRHPHAQKIVYKHPYFMHDESGDYVCPYGDCSGDVNYVCFDCRSGFQNSKRV